MRTVKRTIDAWQYVTDHTTILLQANVKLGQGIRFRLILDRGHFYYSSCARQALRVQELWLNGAHIRVLLPKRKEGGGKGFPQMHCRTSIYDGTVALTGLSLIHI
eukprot:12060726-Karenia_brevis.AAC.1